MSKMRYALLIALAVAAMSPTLPARAGDKPHLADARPMVMVPKTGRYKVVYDIHSDAMTAGIANGLYYARGLFEAFRKQGVPPAHVDAHLVLHGDAAFMLLNDEAFQKMVSDPFAANPNDKIVQDLLDLGASVEICHSAMKSHGWKADDILPGVTIVHDGYTRLVKLQNDGYAYIGGY